MTSFLRVARIMVGAGILCCATVSLSATEYSKTKSFSVEPDKVYAAAEQLFTWMQVQIIEKNASQMTIRFRFDSVGRRRLRENGGGGYAIFSVAGDPANPSQSRANLRIVHPRSQRQPLSDVPRPSPFAFSFDSYDSGLAKQFFNNLKFWLGP